MNRRVNFSLDKGATPIKRWKRKYTILILILILIVITAVGYFLLSPKAQAPTNNNKSDTVITNEKKEETSFPKMALVDLQPTLDQWLQTQTAKYSIEIYDVNNNKVVAAHNENESYFTASLYKLYVAYFGYRNLTSGVYKDQANYQGNHSRLDCLVLMIKDSDSPCAETMMAELGRDYINSQLDSIGATHTNFGSLTTSAHDMDQLILNAIETKSISDKYKNILFESMENQIYRQGLAKGFTKAKTVASKVGFNLDINYHESALVTFDDGHQYIVSVLSQGQGSPRPLAILASELQEKILQTNNKVAD